MSFQEPETVRQLDSVINAMLEKRQGSSQLKEGLGGIVDMGDLAKVRQICYNNRYVP